MFEPREWLAFALLVCLWNLTMTAGCTIVIDGHEHVIAIHRVK